MKKVIVAGAIILVIGVFILFQKSQNPSFMDLDKDSTVIVPSPQNTSQPVANGTSVTYKDGSYTGKVGSASQYGDVQVKVTISGGKITDIEYLQFPSGGGHTAEVTAIAKPALKQEAITAQSANINVISGATQDVNGFIESLQSALDQAKV